MNMDILNFLQAIWSSGEVREIRAFDEQGWPTFGFFDSPEKACQAIQKIERTHTVYITINPCHRDLLSRSANRMRKPKRARQDEKKFSESTSDQNIIEQKFILVDLDPKRISGISATAAEKEKASLLSEEIVISLGKPYIHAFSGNGYHLIYRHNASDSKQLSEFLKGLDVKFSNEWVSVDCTTFNPSRITKVIGTWARKGDNTPDRPWTQSKLLYVNQDSVILDIPTFLEKSPAKISTHEAISVDTKTISTIKTTFDIRAFLSENGVIITKEKPMTGRTMLILKGGCVFDSSHTEGEAAICLHESGLITYQCFHNSCHGRTWEDFRVRIGAPKKGESMCCNTCGRPISWRQNNRGKWLPIENNERHFCNKKNTVSKPDTEPEIELEPEIEERKSNIAFDLEKFHPIYKRYISQFSSITDTPDQFVLQAFTVALAATLGNRVYLKVGPKIYPNLFALVIAPSTEFRKTTAIGLGVSPLRSLNSEKKHTYKQMYASWKNECEGLKPKERPAPPKHLCNIYPEELTPECLLGIMQDKSDGLFFFSEIGTFLSMMEKNYGKGLKEMLTCMYDVPSEYSRETVGGGEIIIEHPAPSLIAASTSEWIQKHVSESDMFSGFLARFQVAILREMTKKPIAIPDFFSIAPQWTRFFSELETFEHAYIISDKARKLYCAWFEFHRKNISDEDSFLKSFLLRIENVVHKYAIIYQAIDDCSNHTKSEHISVENYGYALVKAQWDIENISSCYSELISPPDYTQQRILEILKKYSDESGRLCKRDLAKRAHLRVKELDEVIETLKIKGYMIEEQRGKHVFYKIAK